MPSVGEIARAVGAKVIGNEHTAVTGVASIALACGSDIVFVENEIHLNEALNSAAAAVIAGSFAERSTTKKKDLLIAANPRLAFARAASMFPTLSHQTREEPAVLPKAAVADTAVIDPWTFVGESASIGERTWIGAGCVIGRAVPIGEDCKIYPNVTTY